MPSRRQVCTSGRLASLSGEPYVTYRLVRSARVGNAIKQTTVLNLGSHFDLPQAHWPALAKRIDELVHGHAAVGNIVARMAQPCSELATHAWLRDTSALGELMDYVRFREDGLEPLVPRLCHAVHRVNRWQRSISAAPPRKTRR